MHGKMMTYLMVAGASVVVGLLIAGTPIRSALPLVFVLACPLMMMFMMRGMHGGGTHHQRSTRSPRTTAPLAASTDPGSRRLIAGRCRRGGENWR